MARGPWQSEQDAINLCTLDQCWQLSRVEYFDPVDIASLKLAVVIDVRHRLMLAAHLERRRQLRACFTRAINGNPHGAAIVTSKKMTRTETAAPNVKQRQRPVDCKGRKWHFMSADSPVVDTE